MANAQEAQRINDLVDSLPLSQYLIIEVLIARARLGENFWTFPPRANAALNALKMSGLVFLLSTNGDGSLRAGLERVAREALVTSAYTPPIALPASWVEHTAGNEELISSVRAIHTSVWKALSQEARKDIGSLTQEVALDTHLSPSWVQTILIAMVNDRLLDVDHENASTKDISELQVWIAPLGDATTALRH